MYVSGIKLSRIAFYYDRINSRDVIFKDRFMLAPTMIYSIGWLGKLVQPQEWTPNDNCSTNPSSYHTLFFRRVSEALLYIISKHHH
jgi:hypothetical protein